MKRWLEVPILIRASVYLLVGLAIGQIIGLGW